MQVLATFGIGPVGVPAGSHCSKHLDIVSIAARVENQCITQGLEQCKISVRLGGVREDILTFHLVLILANHSQNTVIDLIDCQVCVATYGHSTLL